ncbi:MAG: DUF3575 domain-containing protein [Alistipes sp.]|jgi:hypothetical protein|nr:DUF3575 domain-containing protein [Alistipes sp.]
MKKFTSNRVISRSRLLAAALALTVFFAANAQGQGRYGNGAELPRWNIKTNLLYDLTGTINLGAEFRVGDRLSLDLPFNYNPFQYADNRKWKHFLFQPELRRWLGDDVFRGHFVGFHAHYAFFNIGNLPKPFSAYMQAHRFEGNAYGAGVSWGHRWNFGSRWGLEATVGVGYIYKDYDVFECGTCGEFIASEQKHYFGPTKVGVSLIFGGGGRKAAPVVEAPRPTPPVYVMPAPPAYEPNLSTSYVIPDVESPKVRSATHTAYLDFEQGRAEIIDNLRNNAAELRRIDEITRGVTRDDNSTVTGVSITGYASPEDTYERNMALSQRRTEAVSGYVNQRHSLPLGVIRASGRGEDWETLDSLVSLSSIPDKGLVLGIIRGGGDADYREEEIKKLSGGATYRRIFDEFYPRLRRTDYRVDYTVAGFSVEEGKQVLRTNPRNLSLNEMYLIANTYEPGSRAFNEVFETAVRMFPTSDVANINAAAAALEGRDLGAATRYLSAVREQTPAYWNNLGVLQWLQGNKQGAADSFSRAGIQSMGNASEVERHFRSLQR